jgi:cell division transport system ATP-binding protein
VIEFYSVAKEYHGRRVLKDVTFQVGRGEFVFLTGPSGAGKSTLLKMLFRAERPTSGQILVNGMNVGIMPHGRVPELRRSMGIVFQDYKLLPTRNVFENVVRPQVPRRSGRARGRGAPTRRCGSWAHAALRPARGLSGGEQQRASRGPVNDPSSSSPTSPRKPRSPSRERVMKLAQINVRGTTVPWRARHGPHQELRAGDASLDRGRVLEARRAALPPQAQGKRDLPVHEEL